MSEIVQWPPVPQTGPPSTQYQIGMWQNWRCIVSHLEPGPEGCPSPHFVVDWTQEANNAMPYPFLPSAVPGFLQDIWLKNCIANRPLVKKGIDLLKDKHWGLPGFVIGTGPSLAKNMDALKGLKNGVVIATNNALNVLPPEVPIDYYCVVDGRLPERWWVESKRRDFDLVSVPLVTEKITKHFDPERIYWARFAGSDGPNKCFQDYPELPNLEPGYVVGFSATNLAFYLGCNPIVFVGMDCCITNGYLHAGDVSKYQCQEGEDYCVVADIYDVPQVSTSTYLRGMWKLAAAAKLNGCHKKFINATEGGILKDFCSVVPLKEVISWQG